MFLLNKLSSEDAEIYKYMSTDLQDSLKQSANSEPKLLAPDASSLALLASIRWPEEARSNLRYLGSLVLRNAGYCECGTKITEYPRCSLCGRLR